MEDVVLPCHAIHPQAKKATTSIAYPLDQITVCRARSKCGSIISGYPSRAARLPTLLAAYKKYGSFDDGSPVRANQCCRIGALAATTTNGRPAEVIRVQRSHGLGFDCVGGTRPLLRPIGSATSARMRTHTCNATWRRPLSHADVACA